MRSRGMHALIALFFSLSVPWLGWDWRFIMRFTFSFLEKVSSSSELKLVDVDDMEEVFVPPAVRKYAVTSGLSSVMHETASWKRKQVAKSAEQMPPQKKATAASKNAIQSGNTPYISNFFGKPAILDDTITIDWIRWISLLKWISRWFLWVGLCQCYNDMFALFWTVCCAFLCFVCGLCVYCSLKCYEIFEIGYCTHSALSLLNQGVVTFKLSV